jgi:hypothetical protein
VGGVAAPAVAVAGPRVASYFNVADHLRYGDLVGPDRKADVLRRFEHVLRRRITTQQREIDSECDKAYRAAIKAVNDQGVGSAMVGLDDEEPAVLLAEALRASVLPPPFVSMKLRPVERRRLLAREIALKGMPDAALVTECLPHLKGMAEFSGLGSFLAGELVPSQLQLNVTSLAAALEISGVFGEAMVRAVERRLRSDRHVGEGATPADRIAALEEHLTVRKLARDTAPKQESADSTAGITALPSHTKMQQDALYAVYATANFKEQEAAIDRMDEPLAYLHLALTASFLGALGAAGGPIDQDEKDRAAHWTPIPVLHQLVWGKVQSLQGKEGMRKLVTARTHMPRLLAVLAARDWQGLDAAGKERIANVRLEALWAQLQAKSWNEGKLDVINDMWAPMFCAFHDMSPELQPRVPLLMRYDMALMRAALPMLAGVMTVVTVPLGGAYSVRAWLAPAERMLQLHAPAAKPEQLEFLNRAVSQYIETSLEDFVTIYNQARFEADASATFRARLGDGEALGQLNQCLRAFNGTASRKRAADSSDGLLLFQVPHTQYGVAARPFQAVLDGRASPGPEKKVRIAETPATLGVARGARETFDAGIWDYDLGKVKAWLQKHGQGNKCAPAMCMGGWRGNDADVAIKKACPCYGTKGHVGYGRDAKGAHQVPKDFPLDTFRVAK